MQRSILQFSVAVCLAVGAGAQVSAQNVRLRADIPFEFTIGNERIPAGLCVIETTTTAGVLKLRSESGGESAFLAGGVMTVTGGTDESWFSFRQYGDQYFLAGVRTGWNGVAFSFVRSRIEKEKALTAKAPATRIILARR